MTQFRLDIGRNWLMIAWKSFLRKTYWFARWHGLTNWRVGDTSQVRLTFRQRNWGKIVFSQHGEDLVLHRLLFTVLRLEPSRPYTYVDVGAYHPFDHSLTAHLSLLGWRGIAIDFSDTTASAFARYRPNTVFVHGAAGSGGESRIRILPGKVRYGDAGLLSSTEPAHNGGLKTVRVSDVVDSIGMGAIDFLSVDVEGAELSVLKGIDFRRHAPLLISVEIHGIMDLTNLEQEPVAKFLFSKGYVAVAATVINFFFILEKALDQSVAETQS